MGGTNLGDQIFKIYIKISFQVTFKRLKREFITDLKG